MAGKHISLSISRPTQPAPRSMPSGIVVKNNNINSTNCQKKKEKRSTIRGGGRASE